MGGDKIQTHMTQNKKTKQNKTNKTKHIQHRTKHDNQETTGF